MRFLLINHVQNAKQSLKCSRVRSTLTMLGITIGVASITTILSLSGGASRVISSQIDALGGNIAVIKPGVASSTVNNVAQTQSTRDYATSTLTEKDITYIENTPQVQSAAPLMVLSGTIKADSVASSSSVIVATTPKLQNIANLKLRDGQFLDNQLDKNTVVVGLQLSIDTFGTESSIGKILTIRGQNFTVVGVLKRINEPVNYNSVDFDNAAIINFEVGKSLNQNVAQIQQIDVKADSVSNLNKVVASINKTIKNSHKGENDFSVLIGDKISQPTSQLFFMIAKVTTAIAAISLIVGGIGIMNIMLVTVAERSREIGIRKALGASNADISWQFLIESLAISLGGCVSGYILGYIIAIAISKFLIFTPVFTWQIAITALIVSLITGTLFGLYPALRAAHKDPIESLHRYE